MPELTEKFDEAPIYASELHRTQKRKGTEIPYVSHLLAVAGLVIEAGGSEIEAIAALLHDAVEDQGGQPTLVEIEKRFAKVVADIVDACSDTDVVPKPPWQERKEAYIVHLESASDAVILVSSADKLHNARAILADYQDVGEELWDRFNGTKDQTLWYYRTLVTAYRLNGAKSLVNELEEVVTTLEALARN